MFEIYYYIIIILYIILYYDDPHLINIFIDSPTTKEGCSERHYVFKGGREAENVLV
jgi:hypothetical protein